VNGAAGTRVTWMANREVEWAGAHESAWAANEFQAAGNRQSVDAEGSRPEGGGELNEIPF